jgi:DNA primase
MARIKDSSINDVRAAADMVEVVSGRTQLRRASGSRYMGRCPFHEERTPSFSVNAVDKLYHCFGCGKGGDLIGFVQETENLDFVGAIEWLAERFRVTLEYEEASPRQEEARRRRERLNRLLEDTTAYFERLLWEGDGGAPVRAYLAERGLGEEIAREFRLGLSPGKGLAAKAREKGFTVDELRAAGLTTVRGGDYFPRRLMFPLADARGRIVGYQARKLSDDDPLRGKYVNSPESDLFKKGAILYGLHLAKTAIAKQDRVLVVEGNTDVIALRQAGFEPVIASMGTALTEHQLREIGRLTKKLFFCFDSDSAGQKAAARANELAKAAKAHQFDVKVILLRDGDPADAPHGFDEKLEQAESYLLFLVEIELGQPTSRQERFVRVNDILEGVQASPDRQEAVRRASDRLGVPPEAFAVSASSRVDRRQGIDTTPRLLEAGDRLERDTLAACLAHPALVRGLAELGPEYFDSEVNRKFRAVLVSGRDDPELTPLRAELDARAAQEAIDERTGKELLLRLRERKLKRDLAGADLAKTTELQAHLAKVRQAIAELT